MRMVRVLQAEVNPTVTTVQVPIVEMDEYGSSRTTYIPQQIKTSVVVFPTGPSYTDYYLQED